MLDARRGDVESHDTATDLTAMKRLVAFLLALFMTSLASAQPSLQGGVDVDAEGRGVVNGDRLYQLVRQRGPVKERTFEIRFDKPGVRAYAFTFG